MTKLAIISKLKQLKSVLIFSHNRPDGDTIGSAIALYLAFKKLGVTASLCCESQIPQKYDYLPEVKLYEKSAKYAEKVDDFDAVVAVDCASEVMFSDAYRVYSKGKVKFNIDHHISNSRYADYNYVEETSATTEIMLSIIKGMGVEIDANIADCLLLGIVTDTGNFAHSNVSNVTLENASVLLKAGGNLNKTVREMFKNQSRERAELYAKTISKIRYELDGKLAFIVISRKDIVNAGGDDSITEGFIDFPLSIKGVEVAISLLETGDKRYKISFRSKGVVNVNEIASIYGGGGHILASGAVMNGYLEDIIDKLTFNVKQRI